MSGSGVDAAWLGRLRQRVDLPPARPRVAWAVAVPGRPPAAVGSIESTLALELAGAGLPWRDTGTAWCLELPSADRIDPALAEAACWLRSRGRASAWRDELLDVADAAGRVLGAIERAAVRPLGIATRAVHLLVWGGRGVWVQQRAADKSVDPGLWDTTMGGLVSAGETIAQTLERETWEEAGIRLDQLDGVRAFGRFTVRRPLTEGYMVEHIELFEATADPATEPVNQDGEVARFECLDRSQLLDRLRADVFTLEAAMAFSEWLDAGRAAGDGR